MAGALAHRVGRLIPKWLNELVKWGKWHGEMHHSMAHLDAAKCRRDGFWMNTIWEGCIHKAQSKESWSITPATNAMHWKPEESNSIIATIGQTVETFRSNLDGHTRKRINGNKLIKSVLATVSLTKQPYRGHLSHSLLLSSLSWC